MFPKPLRLRLLFTSNGRKRKESDDKIPSNKTIAIADSRSRKENHFVGTHTGHSKTHISLTLLIQHLQTDKKRSEKTKVSPPEIRPRDD